MNPEDVATVYEKNPHDTVPQNVVPEEVIWIQSEDSGLPTRRPGSSFLLLIVTRARTCPSPRSRCWSRRPGIAQLISKIWRSPSASKSKYLKRARRQLEKSRNGARPSSYCKLYIGMVKVRFYAISTRLVDCWFSHSCNI